MYPKLKGVCEGNSAEAAEFVRLITDLIEETIREQDPLADCADALRQLPPRKLYRNSWKERTMSEIGHNSLTSDAKDQLKAFVERIERLEEEKKIIADDIKDVYAEAKANGLDKTVLRKVIAIRRRDANEVAEEDALIDLYLHALGMEFLT